MSKLDRIRRDASRNSVSPALERRSTEPNRSTATGISHPGMFRDRARHERAAQSQLRAIGRVMKVAQAKMDEKLNAGREIRPAMVRHGKDKQATEGRESAATRKVTPQRARGR